MLLALFHLLLRSTDGYIGHLEYVSRVTPGQV